MFAHRRLQLADRVGPGSCGWSALRRSLLRGLDETPDQPAPDDRVRQGQHPPVRPSGDPAGVEQGPLLQHGGADTLEYLPFDPGPARKLHLRPQAQQPGRLVHLHPEEVEGVAGPELVGVASTPTHADPAEELVDPSPGRPQPVGGVPAAVAAHSGHGREHRLGRGKRASGPDVGQHGATGPVGILGLGRRRGAGGGVVDPAGGCVEVLHMRQGAPQGFVERCRRVRAQQVGQRGGVRHHHIVAQAVDQGPGQSDGQGRHQVDPVRGQAGAQNADRYDQAGPEPGHRRVPLHHLLVGEHVWAADLDAPVGPGGQVEGGHQAAQHVGDGDGLAAGAGHPPGADHHRQDLHEVAQHLEGGAARADDDRGPQLGQRHRPRPEDAPHFVAAGQVVRQGRGVVDTKAAEVDETPHPGFLGRHPGVASAGAVGLLEVVAVAHRVDEVVDGVEPREGPEQRRPVEHVGGHDLDIGPPRHAVEPARGAGQATDPVPRAQQFRHEPSAHIASGADDADSRSCPEACCFDAREWPATTRSFQADREPHSRGSRAGAPP